MGTWLAPAIVSRNIAGFGRGRISFGVLVFSGQGVAGLKEGAIAPCPFTSSCPCQWCIWNEKNEHLPPPCQAGKDREGRRRGSDADAYTLCSANLGHPSRPAPRKRLQRICQQPLRGEGSIVLPNFEQRTNLKRSLPANMEKGRPLSGPPLFHAVLPRLTSRAAAPEAVSR